MTPHETPAQFLAARTPLFQRFTNWDDGRLPLLQTSYLGTERPPLDLVTSIRAILFRESELMVVRGTAGDLHIVPGGRRESGETIPETLSREILEETGWRIRDVHPIGFIHFHHLAPKKSGYPYPHPDFFQLLFSAEADRFVSAAQAPDDGERSAGFRPAASIPRLPIDKGQLLFLETALSLRRNLLEGQIQ